MRGVRTSTTVMASLAAAAFVACTYDYGAFQFEDGEGGAQAGPSTTTTSSGGSGPGGGGGGTTTSTGVGGEGGDGGQGGEGGSPPVCGVADQSFTFDVEPPIDGLERSPDEPGTITFENDAWKLTAADATPFGVYISMPPFGLPVGCAVEIDMPDLGNDAEAIFGLLPSTNPSPTSPHLVLAVERPGPAQDSTVRVIEVADTRLEPVVHATAASTSRPTGLRVSRDDNGDVCFAFRTGGFVEVGECLTAPTWIEDATVWFGMRKGEGAFRTLNP